MNGIKIQEKNGGAQGRYRFLSFAADPSVPVEERKRRILAGEVSPKRVSGWNKNLIVSSDGYGLNIICQQLAGITTIPVEIAEIQLGTGNTAPSAGDTGLETPVAAGILRATQDVTNDEVSLSFFASDLEVPNGTYKEVGIFAGGSGDRRLFARSIISPDYTKGSAEDTTIEYIIEFTAV